jgi:hypothetical protein
MYYPDLSEYEYIEKYATLRGLNIGWLDAKPDFPAGEPQPTC